MNFPKKAVTASALVAVLATSTILPNYTFAADNQVIASVKTDDITLAPTNIQNVLNSLAASKLIMNASETAITTQGNVHLDIMPELADYQQEAREHATYYADNLDYLLLSASKDIIDFGNEFNNYYDSLIATLDRMETDETAKDQFLTMLEYLQRDIQTHRDAINDTRLTFQDYKDSLQDDHFNFQNAATTTMNEIKLDDRVREYVLDQMHELNGEITNESNVLIPEYIEAGVVGLELTIFLMAPHGALAALGIGLATGAITTGTILGNIGLQEKQEKLNDLMDEYYDTMKDLDGLELQAAALEVIQGQLNSFYESNDGIIHATRDLYFQWDEAYQGIQKLKDQIKSGEVNTDAIKGLLENAKQTWGNSKDQADYIDNQLNLVGDIKTIEIGENS
ncbi:HBL/NHE enterotoxin family protein [Jeotgalibacillus marinus]|uniref:HBL/NHE enterotoxin family protein n=1 Tax=Jeotgalibacillus marinus TaxID=86667 RepID=A0ABV3Q6C1_9BACL